MKKRILILASALDIGGVQKSLVSLLQSVDYNKYDIDLIVKRGGILEKYIPKQVNIIDPPNFYKWIFIPKINYVKGFFKSIGKNLNFIRYLYYSFKGLFIKNMGKARQQLQESAMVTLPKYNQYYDVAIDYTGNFKSLLSNLVDSSKKISWVHSDYRVYSNDKSIDAKYYEVMDDIVTVSQSCRDIFVSEFPQFESKTHIMQNVSSKESIQEMSEEIISFDNSYSGIKILDITRLDPNKGLEIAIESCRKLIDEGYDIKWYIIGDGPEKDRLEKLIKQNDLENKFFLLGFKANPYPYIKQADLIVHCSLFEGRSVAIDEAMILSKPIILTDYPTAKDQISNKENGIICETSIEGVSEAVKSLIDNESLKEKLIDNLTNFDLSVKKSIDVFDYIIQKR